MPDLRRALTQVSIQTDIRSLHKLYEAMYGARRGKILSLDEDANLKRLFDGIEQVLVRSGYMSEPELRAIRAPVFATWDVKG